MSEIAGRALRGIEAAAFVVRHSIEAYAVAGGEGARRLATALAAASVQGPSGAGGLAPPVLLEGQGLDAARAVIGSAAAGRRSALLVSGEAAADVLPAVREMVRLGLPVLLVVPSHGADVGATWPAPEPADIAVLATLPLGVLVAGDAPQAVELLLAAQRASVERGAPFVVAFDFGTVGLSLASVALPDAARVREWAEGAREPEGARSAASEHTAIDSLLSPPESAEALERYRRAAERFSFALSAAMRGVERMLRRPVSQVVLQSAHGATVRDADVVVLAMGPAARAAALAAQGMNSVVVAQVTSFRPFPAAEIVRQAWRARAIVVHEPLPDLLGGGGMLANAVRAAFADALTWHPAFTGIGRIPPVVTAVGHGASAAAWRAALRAVAEAADPPRIMALAGDGAARGDLFEARVDVVIDEGERELALRFCVDWLARGGVRVRAHADGLARAAVSIARSAGGVPVEARRAASHVWFLGPGATFDVTRVQALPTGAVVVLAGDHPDRVLAEAMRAGAARGVRVATLGGHGASVRTAAALAAVSRVLVDEEGLDGLLNDAAGAAFEAEGPAVASEVRAHCEALRAHLRA